jgi:hypothetical protein
MRKKREALKRVRAGERNAGQKIRNRNARTLRKRTLGKEEGECKYSKTDV